MPHWVVTSGQSGPRSTSTNWLNLISFFFFSLYKFLGFDRGFTANKMFAYTFGSVTLMFCSAVQLRMLCSPVALRHGAARRGGCAVTAMTMTEARSQVRSHWNAPDANPPPPPPPPPPGTVWPLIRHFYMVSGDREISGDFRVYYLMGSTKKISRLVWIVCTNLFCFALSFLRGWIQDQIPES